MSADSGIATFRDSDGLWANHKVEEICTAEAMIQNRNNVIDFYNERRKEILSKEPNEGHLALVRLEKYFEVEVITQNIDNFHERAGSSHITHLHGEITKLRSSLNETDTITMEGWKQSYDARHADGSLLRPYIVFFGEGVPNFEKAIQIAKTAELFIVIGTSLQVYPAASLLQYVRREIPIYLVDPGFPKYDTSFHITHIKKRAKEGVPYLVEELIKKYGK